MKQGVRIFAMLAWLGALIVLGLIVLLMAGSRIGAHKSSTYGYAYERFVDSWGGEIGIVPPHFVLVRSFPVKQFNADAKRYEIVMKSQRTMLIPESIELNSMLRYGRQYINWLTFNAFTAECCDTYVVRNDAGFAGKLTADFEQPENANLIYDYRVTAGGRVLRPVEGVPTLIVSNMQPDEEISVVVAYKTKGMDVFKYNLSNYHAVTVRNLAATIGLNTNDFQLYRFGLPHTIVKSDKGSILRSEIKNFSTSQDLGVEFESKQTYLDQIKALVDRSPLSLLMFLLVVFIFSQVMRARFNSFHYLFVAAIHVFYFLFVAYLIRFLSVWPTFGVSAALMVLMYLAYCPKVFGWRFAGKVIGPYLLALTVIYSLIFLMPIFRGLMLIILMFAVFVSVMIAVSRSDVSRWDIVTGGREESES